VPPLPRLLSAVAGACLLVVLLPGAPASAQEQPTTSDQTARVVNGPPGSPEIALEYDLYVPAGASAADPRPAIVMTNGFGGSKDIPEITSTANLLVRQGYLVLAYSAAGFGQSGGCISLQSIDRDARGTQQLVDQVLDVRDDVLRDAAGELVLGTVGGSYGGGWQLPFAALDERVKAAAPGRTWQLLRYSLNPNNRVVPGDPTGFSHQLSEQGVFKAQWTSLFFAVGNAQPAMGNGGCPSTSRPPATPRRSPASPSARATWSSCARCTAASWRPATSTPPAASCSTARRARPSSTPSVRASCRSCSCRASATPCSTPTTR
jgi:ABC-2 type transport system ATP-binding protein